MKTKVVLFHVIYLMSMTSFAQRLIDRSGEVTFFSEAPVENIEAVNKQALCAMDLSNGNIAASMLMKSFRFKKALMEEHFNENYVESGKFPKSTFKGSIENFDATEFQEKGAFTKTAKGEITIHGITQPLETEVSFRVDADLISAETKFMLLIADFDIKIPLAVVNNIAEEIKINVSFQFSRP
ncbi:YceI family protein [Reichenbachiella sp. MALMAid0571]|uniref:YceI family protein n=1 Tax=Reichenbachiella sp. MALMAid0571 TaxID=3143939 RepID=UPI0032DFBA70